MNELNHETSPYLLQHANNPVHWKGWNDKALALAKNQNKLMIISVGYSACHWCHVMEHESFEDTDVAKTMNENFISIKVDREERPDIDAVYMKAVQVMTGQGGWPMNVVCLPDGKPVWGGTYFRKNDWISYLQQLQELHLQQPEKLVAYAQQLQEGLQAIQVVQNESTTTNFNESHIEILLEKWIKSFDWEYGGMARAPKFMMPTNYEFLLRYGYQTQNKNLLNFVNLTLTKMAHGGLFDTVDGGFSRYSVDVKWHIPHFEKMLYDNGQLVSLYANAYKLTQNNLYRDVIQKTLAFVENEWLSSQGGFYAALDADSLNHNNRLEEGAFYVWTKTDLQQLLTSDFELFSQVFNINDFGYWEHQNYVLIQNQPLEVIAAQNGISVADLQYKKRQWEQQLYIARKKRNKPQLDDKCLCSWNALMLKGFTDAYKALQNPNYLAIALKNGEFILTHLLSPEGHLYHTYKNNKATINGYLEDYCFVIDAFISLYQVTMNENWIRTAKQLTDYCLDHFYDPKIEFFQFTSQQDEALITTHFEIEDNVIPASNSVMAANLIVLSSYFNHSYYKQIAQRMIHHVLPNIDYPSAFSNWLNVVLHLSDNMKELAICGAEAPVYLAKLNQLYLPDIIIAGTKQTSNLPFLQERFVAEKTLFYWCQNKTCQPPTANFETIKNKITNS